MDEGDGGRLKLGDRRGRNGGEGWADREILGRRSKTL